MLELDGTLIIIAISFILFVLLMQKVLYAPISEIRAERNNYIDENLSAGKSLRAETAEIVKLYNNEILNARIEANKIISEHSDAAGKEKQELIEKKSFEINDSLNQAKELVQKEKEAAKDQLKPQILDLAYSISTKVLGKEVPVSGITQEMIDKAFKG